MIFGVLLPCPVTSVLNSSVVSKNVVPLPLEYDAFDVKGLKPNINPLCFTVINEKISFILESKFENDENYVEIRGSI